MFPINKEFLTLESLRERAATFRASAKRFKLSGDADIARDLKGRAKSVEAEIRRLEAEAAEAEEEAAYLEECREGGIATSDDPHGEATNAPAHA